MTNDQEMINSYRLLIHNHFHKNIGHQLVGITREGYLEAFKNVTAQD